MGRDDISATIHLEQGYTHKPGNDYDMLLQINSYLRDVGKLAICFGSEIENHFSFTMLSFMYCISCNVNPFCFLKLHSNAVLPRFVHRTDHIN